MNLAFKDNLLECLHANYNMKPTNPFEFEITYHDDPYIRNDEIEWLHALEMTPR